MNQKYESFFCILGKLTIGKIKTNVYLWYSNKDKCSFEHTFFNRVYTNIYQNKPMSSINPSYQYLIQNTKRVWF